MIDGSRSVMEHLENKMEIVDYKTGDHGTCS